MCPEFAIGGTSGIGPFRGQLVRQHVAHDVISPAYDSLTSAQRRQFRADHPNSYLHVTRSAVDEDDAEVVDTATLVARGRFELERLIDLDVFASIPSPAYYAYRLATPGHTQTGLVCEIDPDYFVAHSKPHEAVDAARVELLAEHFVHVAADSSPVACAVRDDEVLALLLEQATAGEPELLVAADDGLRQSLWRIDDASLVDQIEAALFAQPIFLIDGHHRAAANQRLAEQGLRFPLLAAIFPAHSLHLVGFHRLLKLPSRLSTTEFVDAIVRRFQVEVVSDVATADPGTVAMMVDGRWMVVHFDEVPVSGGPRILLGSLDVVVLEREILQAIVAAAGELDVTYIPDSEPFATIVDHAQRDGRVPMFVAAVTVDDMMTVADGGLVMPAKSTYFTPKVRSGLFLRRFR